MDPARARAKITEAAAAAAQASTVQPPAGSRPGTPGPVSPGDGQDPAAAAGAETGSQEPGPMQTALTALAQAGTPEHRPHRGTRFR